MNIGDQSKFGSHNLHRNTDEILIKIQNCSFKKVHLKMSSAKWPLFSFGLSVLIPVLVVAVSVDMHQYTERDQDCNTEIWTLKIILNGLICRFLRFMKKLNNPFCDATTLQNAAVPSGARCHAGACWEGPWNHANVGSGGEKRRRKVLRCNRPLQMELKANLCQKYRTGVV